MTLRAEVEVRSNKHLARHRYNVLCSMQVSYEDESKTISISMSIGSRICEIWTRLRLIDRYDPDGTRGWTIAIEVVRGHGRDRHRNRDRAWK